jgi:hypothetical protein
MNGEPTTWVGLWVWIFSGFWRFVGLLLLVYAVGEAMAATITALRCVR